MPENRYAFLFGSTEILDSSMRPLDPRVVDTNLEIMKAALEDLGDYSFVWPDFSYNERTGEVEEVKYKSPLKRRNLYRGKLISKLEELQENGIPKTNDIFLFYYFGHGYIKGNNELCLAFKNQINLEGDTSSFHLSTVLSEIVNIGFKKVVLIADCCHAGIARRNIRIQNQDAAYFLMASTTRGWSFFDKESSNEGFFTRRLVETLSYKARMGARAKGRDAITFQSWFDYTKELVKTDPRTNQIPICDEGGDINISQETIVPIEIPIKEQLITKHPTNSVYYRFYLILSIIQEIGKCKAIDVYGYISNNNVEEFKVVYIEGGERTESFVGVRRINDYLYYTAMAGLTKKSEDDDVYSLTDNGVSALGSDGAQYNILLAEGLLNRLKELNISRSDLNEVLFELAGEAKLPNVKNIEMKLKDRSKELLPRKDFSMILKLLGYSNVIQRAASETYFPQ